jgi:hypothetical protein
MDFDFHGKMKLLAAAPELYEAIRFILSESPTEDYAMRLARELLDRIDSK